VSGACVLNVLRLGLHRVVIQFGGIARSGFASLAVTALLIAGCGKSSPPAPGALPAGWKQLTLGGVMTVYVPAGVHEGPALVSIDYRVYLWSTPPQGEGRLTGPGMSVAWSYSDGRDRWPKDVWREARKRTRYWTSTSDLRFQEGLTRFTTEDSLFEANVSVADDRRLVWMGVIDSILSDSVTVKTILHSVRLVPRMRRANDAP